MGHGDHAAQVHGQPTRSQSAESCRLNQLHRRSPRCDQRIDGARKRVGSRRVHAPSIESSERKSSSKAPPEDVRRPPSSRVFAPFPPPPPPPPPPSAAATRATPRRRAAAGGPPPIPDAPRVKSACTSSSSPNRVASLSTRMAPVAFASLQGSPAVRSRGRARFRRRARTGRGSRSPDLRSFQTLAATPGPITAAAPVAGRAGQPAHDSAPDRTRATAHPHLRYFAVGDRAGLRPTWLPLPRRGVSRVAPARR